MPVNETQIAAKDGDGLQVYFHQSTLPSKEVVEAYESFHSGAAKIMLDMALDEQSHDHSIEIYEAKCDFILRLTGMLVAAVICLSLIVAGTWLMLTDHYVVGAGAVVVAFITVVGSIALGGKTPTSKQ